jgi:Ca-activated chloride channel family protein
MSGKIHIERMMHRNSIAVRGESVASYALLKLIPTGDGTGQPVRLNLALVLDVSGSMYEEDGTNQSRLQRVQNAALAALPKLRPTDTLTIVAFAHNADVVLPPTSLAEQATVMNTIKTIDRFEIDPGGTAMDEGMKLALEQLGKQQQEGTLSYMLILTDGETSGEQNCRQLAQQLAEQKVAATFMGVGTEWNANLIKDLAKLANGTWHYVDVEKAEETEKAFLREFAHLSAAAFTNVNVHLRPVKDVRIKRCRQVVPEIKELALQQPEDRHFIAPVGTLEANKSTRYILDLSLPNRPDGNYVVAQLEVTYNAGTAEETTGLVPLQVAYSATNPSYINAEVAKHIDEVQVFELNNNLQQAISNANAPEVKRLAETIEKKAEHMGPRGVKKTMLARQALSELSSGGRVSKKTQLALEECAKMAEDMPGM